MLSVSLVIPFQWIDNANNCTPIPQGQGGAIPGNLGNVYLGVGSNVPTEIQNLFPSAAATYLEDWKTGMVGLRVNELSSIKIDKSNAYTQPTHELYNKDLFFDVTILTIKTGESVTTRNSVVDVLYTLYTDCIEVSTTGTATNTASTTSPPPPPPDNTLLFLGGGVGIIIILGAVWIYATRFNQQTLSEETLKQTSKRQEASLQSLKKTIADRKVQLDKPKTGKIENSKKKNLRSKRRRH